MSLPKKKSKLSQSQTNVSQKTENSSVLSIKTSPSVSIEDSEVTINKKSTNQVNCYFFLHQLKPET